MVQVAEIEQSTLLNLESKEFNVNFVDENQPLKVFTHPLHWKAHKLQIALERMEKQMKSNPAQFNASVYFSTIDKLGDLMEQINNEGAPNGKVLDERNVGGSRNGGGASPDGTTKPISLDP